jgi:hypothetical protein
VKAVLTQRLEKLTTDYEVVMNRAIKLAEQLREDERTAQLDAALDAVEVTAVVLQRHLHTLYDEVAFIEISSQLGRKRGKKD